MNQEQATKPCPFCGSSNITSNEWIVDDDHAGKFDADKFNEVPALECMDCLGAAPVVSWNQRPDPWRYPPEMPLAGMRILKTYRRPNGTESWPITHTVGDPEPVWLHQIVRWMPIPEITP